MSLFDVDVSSFIGSIIKDSVEEDERDYVLVSKSTSLTLMPKRSTRIRIAKAIKKFLASMV